MSEPERLFSYLPRPDEAVQHATFGRGPRRVPDRRPGCRRENITTVDHEVMTATSGRTRHPIVVHAGDVAASVQGTAFAGTAAELRRADPYEVDDHQRISVTRMASTPQRSPRSVTGDGRTVGRVVALWRYPVKSMAAEALAEADVSWHGLAGDRRWAFIRDGEVRSGFPWLTLRQRPDLTLYRPSFVEPDRPDASRTMVRTPTDHEFDVVDPALATELGEGVRVIKQDRGVFDTMPLSVITTQTVAGLGALTGSELDVLRFRPNLLIEAANGMTFAEDAWVGCVLRIGGMRMRVDGRDKRCVVVNIDPVTTRRNPAVLRAITRERQVRVGVYGSTVQPGHIAVGDPVILGSG